MTAIAVRSGGNSPPAAADQITVMLGAMRRRGSDQVDRHAYGGLALGASRFAWEGRSSDDGQGVVRRGVCAVVADASLYYQSDLRKRLATAGVPTRSVAPGDLILAAYEAFGEAFVTHLEGDFAFALWDERKRRLLAARDFGGKRTIYYHARGDMLVLASTIGGVLADSRVPRDLSVPTIAAVAAGLWVNTPESCYSAVNELRGGHLLRWEPTGQSSVSQFWHPPERLERDTGDSGAAAEQLLHLLSRATEERLASDGPTAVSLSGGWDSTAVFASANHVLETTAHRGRSVRAVSISYPEGDPGREDEFIAETTSRWRAEPSWIDVDTIPMFVDPQTEARERDEPWVHPFERWNRALSRTARGFGARVILDGSGGDQLFQVSDVYLADLFRRGQWVELARQWRVRGQGGVRGFLRSAVRPALSPRTLRVLARIRGAGEPRHYLHRAPSFWIRHVFLDAHGVMARELAEGPVLPDSSAVLGETHAFLTYPYFARVSGQVFGFALDEGVELRSPILDDRIVAFAATRPWHERADRAETKILLRRAMRGLVPERVLAPREKRTGITSGYFNRSMQGPGRPLAEALMRNSVLESMGLINPKTLKRAWDYYVNSGDDEIGVRIYFTLQTELWLREHAGDRFAGSVANVASAAAGAS